MLPVLGQLPRFEDHLPELLQRLAAGADLTQDPAPVEPHAHREDRQVFPLQHVGDPVHDPQGGGKVVQQGLAPGLVDHQGDPQGAQFPRGQGQGVADPGEALLALAHPAEGPGVAGQGAGGPFHRTWIPCGPGFCQQLVGPFHVVQGHQEPTLVHREVGEVDQGFAPGHPIA